MWPHGYFETRLIEECARGEKLKQPFAVLRLHVGPNTDAGACERLLSGAIRSGDVLALYGRANTKSCCSTAAPASPRPRASSSSRCWAAPRGSMRARAWRAFPRTARRRRRWSAGPGAAGGEDRDGTEDASVVLQDPAMRALYARSKRIAPANQRSDHRRDRGRQGGDGRDRPPATAARRRAPSCASTAPRCRRPCSRASCSATRRARSPARCGQGRGCSRPRRRHRVPRRGRRDAAGAPGQAPARDREPRR